MFSSRNEWLRKISYALISDICQKEDHLLWVILDHWAMRILVVGCQEQKMLMVGDPRKDGAGRCRAPRDSILQLRMTHDCKLMNCLFLGQVEHRRAISVGVLLLTWAGERWRRMWSSSEFSWVEALWQSEASPPSFRRLFPLWSIIAANGLATEASGA